MALLTEIVPQALAGLADGGCFPYVAPLDTLPPWIVYTPMGGAPIVDLDGPDQTRHCRLAVDVYAADPDTAEAVIQAARAALYAKLRAVPSGEWEGSHEEDTALDRASQQFTFFY